MRIKGIYNAIYLSMHPEIEAVLTEAIYDYPAPSPVTLENAERLLNYIEDLNLERTSRVMPTPSQSFYIFWSVEDWEFHMECTKKGRILYNFCKAGSEKISGSAPLDRFIPQLEKYLLISMA